MTEHLEKDFKNNQVSIKVAAPTLIIPFRQKSWETIFESECWVFTMGDVSFDTYKGPGYDVTTHEAFLLKVERVKFEHTNRYEKWKSHLLRRQLSRGESLPAFNSATSPLNPEGGAGLMNDPENAEEQARRMTA